VNEEIVRQLADPEIPRPAFLRLVEEATQEELRAARALVVVETERLLDLRSALVARRDQLRAEYPELGDGAEDG
jgi:hypothetical protein